MKVVVYNFINQLTNIIPDRLFLYFSDFHFMSLSSIFITLLYLLFVALAFLYIFFRFSI